MTQQELIQKRGWTKKLIDKYLSKIEPEYKKNPYYMNASPMKLWKETDIVTAELNPEFKKDIEAANKRKESAAKAKKTKTNNLLHSIHIEYDFPPLEEAKKTHLITSG